MPLRPIPDRVQAGVELLDRELPGWWERIDLDQLNLQSCFNCVLGQLHRGGYDGDNYIEGLEALGIEEEGGVGFGFDLPIQSSQLGTPEARSKYSALTAAWRNRIEARRVAARGSV